MTKPEANIDMLTKKLNESIRLKFLIVMSCILVAGTVLISFIIATNEGRVLMDSLMSTGQSLASYIATISSNPLIIKDTIQLDEIVMDAARDNNIAYVVICDAKGVPITSQYASINYNIPIIKSILLSLSPDNDLSEIIDIIKKQEPIIEISSPILMGPVMVSTKTIGKVIVGISRHNIYHEFVKTIVFVVILNILLAIIIIIVLSIISNRMIFEPLYDIADASYRIAKGDLSTEIKINTTGEIKMLVDSFNSMVRDLEKITVSKDYVDNIINSMINALVVASADDVIIKANAATCKLLGYEEEELIGRSASTVFSKARSNRDSWKGVMLAAGRIGNIEEWYCQKDGREVPVLLSASVMHDHNNLIQGIVYVAQDISDRKRAEEEKAMLEAQLLQAQKLEAIGTLAGGIAHDFNNILVPIIGYAELGLNDMPQPNPMRHGLERILSAATRARDLVKQILAFGRASKEQQQIPVEISSIVKEALKLLSASLPSSIEIRQDIEKGVALADPTQIHQVLLNLCTNAAHAMGEKGILEVRLSRVDLKKSDLAEQSIVDLKPGQYLQLSISDTGCGMDARTMERIFDPYFTTKEIGKGSGLGLAVVHGIVKRQGGAVTVQSEPGKGTLFCIYIPAMEAIVDPIVEIGQDLPTGTERILLVDDEQSVIEMETAIFERLGYDVTPETDSLRALEIFRSRSGEFDLIITDYTMPNLTGTDLSKEIRRIQPDMPIILCTGFSEKVTEKGAMDLGVELAMKPFGMKQIAELVRKVLPARDA